MRPRHRNALLSRPAREYSAMISMLDGRMSAAPSPWTTRARTRSPKPPANTPSVEPTANTTSPSP